MALHRNKKLNLFRKIAFFAFVVILCGLAIARFVRTGSKGNTPSSPAAKTDTELYSTYATSKNCKSCHEEIFRLWETSHHALAEREADFKLDRAAFMAGSHITHGSQRSTTSLSNQNLVITTAGNDSPAQSFVPSRVIGLDPLRQFLVPWPGGRLQATELAFAPQTTNWFDVFGQEDRKSGEWGHWTGRGMTWNAMCAACHNTRLRKHYQKETDSYQTTMVEMGVGCEACHGPMASHELEQSNAPAGSKNAAKPSAPKIQNLPPGSPMLSTCGSCHSRRAELTGEFRPGEAFSDHFALTIPDETDIFYADGQVQEEDYEFTSFSSSRMGAAGVRCTDCHEPHSGKTRVPGNNLCLTCHAAPVPPAPKIDPATHSHHNPGSSGDQCVNCHMPQTVYMQRHSRHDHGFTIPDPLLSKQFQIPNACNRCHAERATEWSLEAVQKWYGARMERPSRARAQVIARVRTGDLKSAHDLLGLLRTETNAFWRAVSANLLKRWTNDKEVASALVATASDTNPLVRSASIRALESLTQSTDPSIQTALRNHLDDNVRAVRLDAAWVLRASLNTNSTAGRDLLSYLDHNADQPAGQLQLGVFWLDRHDLNQAMACFERAVAWDPNSAPLRDALAVGLSLQGKTERAVEELQTACRLAPRDAELRFKLGLALNETGKTDGARVALEQAVKLEPGFAQAWYNLGLAYNSSGLTDSALESLSRAESLDSASPNIPFARATILARLGRVDQARAAASRALELQPGYPEAQALLDSLSR